MHQGNPDWHPLHPFSPFMRAIRFVTVAVIVAAQQIQEVLDQPVIALIVFVVGCIIAALYGWISYKWTGFRVTHEQIELKTGLLFRQHRRIPLDRVEAVDIARPIVARIFGLVELRCEAVSSGGSEMKFQYLAQADAEALREYVLQLRNTPTSRALSSDESTEVHTTPSSTPRALSRTESGEMHTNSEPRLILEIPVTDVVLAYGVIRIAAVALIGATTFLIGASFDLSLGVGIVVGALPVMLAIALTAVKVVENFWGFQVTHDQRGLTVKRGLLNELTQKVPVARIQALRIEEPLFWRPFGRARLIVDVAGYRNVKVDGAAETAVLAPVATRDAINRVLVELIGTLDLNSLPAQPAPSRSKWCSPIGFRFLSIAGNDKWAISRHGIIPRRTDVVAHTKAQSIHVSQGPWQRRFNLGTLNIETAGSRIRFEAPHRDFEEINELAWLSRDLAETNR